MSRSVRDYLKHIRDEIIYLQSESARLQKVDFLENNSLKRAFVRSLEVIGEATKRVPDYLKQEYPDIQWRAIVGMRDHLIHGYFGIDYDIVWDVIENQIPQLSSVINEMLERDDIQ